MNNIKYFRKELGLTITELSERSKLAVGYLSDIENNKGKNPTKDVMERIAAALERNVVDVFYSDIEIGQVSD